MPKKSAAKTAARARQREHGGAYQAHLRSVGGGGGGGSGGDDSDEHERAYVLEDPRYPDSDFADRLTFASAGVVEIADWFFRRFEDPAQGVPHDSGEGGYQYVFGGPYHTTDIVQDAFDSGEFDEVTEDDVARAIRLISNYGWNWVRIGQY